MPRQGRGQRTHHSSSDDAPLLRTGRRSVWCIIILYQYLPFFFFFFCQVPLIFDLTSRAPIARGGGGRSVKDDDARRGVEQGRRYGRVRARASPRDR